VKGCERAMRLAGLLLVTLVSLPGAGAEELALLPVRHLRAEVVGLQLGVVPPADPADADAWRQRWVSDLADQVARDPGKPSDRPAWVWAASAQPSPAEAHWLQEAPQRRMAPEGLTSVVVVASQNALLAKGTPAAVDQLRELVAMLDQPVPMVNLEVRLVDAPGSEGHEWGADFWFPLDGGGVGSLGNLPVAGVQASLQLGARRLAAGWDETASRGDVVTSASVTTTSNFPAFISVGHMLPFFSPRVSYDAFGNRQVDWDVDAVFIGTELYAEPRVNRDDTITTYLEPRFIEAAGSVLGPNGIALPITQTLGAATQVTLQDGETIELGGFERSLGEYNDRFAGLLRERDLRVTSHPRLFLTARIVREVPELGEDH
jgi:type II secretory pathway component GspD/PulD (secretin)